MSALSHLASQRLVVCVGPGGVGKTTLAAAFAVDAAISGRRVVVLTIDPARRLASALGLDGLDDAIRSVDLSSVDARGSLSAAMLDTRASYDALIGRIAPNEDARDRILDNRVYRAFSRTLARSHAYVAMERLYEVMRDDTWDLVVLDTPPLRSALDILDAPTRLTRFLDDRVVRWFLGRLPDAEEIAAPTARGVGSAAALRILGAVASRELVEEMVTFFRLFASMREGFTERASEVAALLARSSTSFVLVGAAEPTHLDDARFMRDGLLERGLTPDVVVLNRSFDTEPGDDASAVSPPTEDVDARARRLYPDGAAPDVRRVLTALHDVRRRLAHRREVAMERAHSLADGLPERTRRVVLPELDSEVTSIGALRRLASLT